MRAVPVSCRTPALALATVALVACGRAQPDAGTAASKADAPDATSAAPADADADAAPDAATATSGEVAPSSGAGTLREMIALSSPAPVFTASEWPPKDPLKAAEERKGVSRLGYLRKGARVAVKAGPTPKANCPEGGWFELETGGFVCGKYATLDASSKELRFAPHDPWLDKPLPYDYGLNLTPGTPLYRRLPLKRERKEHEKTLAIGKGAKPSDVARKLKEQGEEVPAYLKDEGDKPKLGFHELKGESDLIAERMLKGFYISLDTKVNGFSGTFWRTVSGNLAPKDHLIVHEGKTEFEGVELAAPGETRKLPLAFVVGTKAKQWSLDAAAKKAKKGEPVERFSIVPLTGKRERVDEKFWFYETRAGFWLRSDHVAVVKPPKIPGDVKPGEKWIDVDIDDEALVAFEGDKPVYATIVSTGRRSSDAAKDHTTVTGSFRIREKHVTDTMDDDTGADGTYKIEDVPWVMYFEKSYALHGAFWHSNFGRERSHGCVNLTPHDARRIFHWVGPTLPKGWHGVAANAANPGTRVIVHK
jgi:lipoprotein-anchoring transpeptidase ErfK/SrfK